MRSDAVRSDAVRSVAAAQLEGFDPE
jgi:hypothetical protein